MRHSVLLFVISLFSPFFSLGIFCQFIVLCRLCMLWNWPHVFKQKARKKEHLMTGSIHFSWQKHLFTSVPCTHATVIIASLPLFFVKGQTIHSQLFFSWIEQIEKSENHALLYQISKVQIRPSKKNSITLLKELKNMNVKLGLIKQNQKLESKAIWWKNPRSTIFRPKIRGVA